MVTPAAKREAVAHLKDAHEMSERRARNVIGCERSTVRGTARGGRTIPCCRHASSRYYWRWSAVGHKNWKIAQTLLASNPTTARGFAYVILAWAVLTQDEISYGYQLMEMAGRKGRINGRQALACFFFAHDVAQQRRSARDSAIFNVDIHLIRFQKPIPTKVRRKRGRGTSL
jgi:hypothetical protein